MKISKSTGMRIATEISAIINQHINIMDNEGYIIASTDNNRIGEFHGAAKYIINENLSEIIIYEDGEFPGTKMGINLPITLEGETVGVVGITGHYKEVEKFGQIIKKMTEILIIDSYRKDQKRLGENIKSRYIEEWVLNSKDNINSNFISRGKQLGINLDAYWTIMIISILSDPGDEDILENQKRIEGFERIIKDNIAFNKKNAFIKHDFKYIIVMTRRNTEEITKLADNIRRAAMDKFEMKLAFGSDTPPTKGLDIHNAYIRAEKALMASITTGNGDLRFYDDVNMELFINEIPSNIKSEYIKKLFAHSPDDEIDEWLKMLDVFFECNGSITKASEELFIHKNTLQYRIKKLASITGYDPRIIKHAALYYIAIQFANSKRK